MKDGCGNYMGAATTAMNRDQNGLVTVTETGHGYQNGDIIWVGRSTPNNYNICPGKNHESAGDRIHPHNHGDEQFARGTAVTFHGLRKATFLNGKR
jgi:hypothetical protein